MALNDKLKGFMRAAGQEAKKLTQVGQLKMELMSAETQLADAHKALGKFVAKKLIEKNETSIEANDPGIAERTEAVQKTLTKIQTLKTTLAQTRP
ncbi:MAG: hypothetical protein AAF581_13865 [Planctomycetota bacterium]